MSTVAAILSIFDIIVQSGVDTIHAISFLATGVIASIRSCKGQNEQEHLLTPASITENI